MPRYQPTDLGSRIQQAIAYKRCTQKELADAIGIHEMTLSRYIHRHLPRKSWDIMVAIAQHTGVSLDFLAGRFPLTGIAHNRAIAVSER